MNRNFAWSRSGLWLFCVLALMTQSAVSHGSELTSQWRTGDVTIDGENTEWEGVIKEVSDQQLGIGLLNDEEFLYMALVVGNHREQLKLLASGCTIWLGDSEDNNKQFGVRYPIGIPRNERRDFMQKMIERGDNQDLCDAYAAQTTMMELVTEASGENRQVAVGEEGIEVVAKPSGTVVLYELKVPLALAGDIAGCMTSDSECEISVGIETAPPMDMANANKRQIQSGKRGGQMGGPGGGRGGSRGGRGGGGGGRGNRDGGPGGQRSDGQRPQPLSFWKTVALASPPAGN